MAEVLDIEVSSTPHLICSKVLLHISHSTVARFANDGFKLLWPAGVHEEKVLFLYADDAAYLLKSTNALKVFYLNFFHFTCPAHRLQHVAGEVTANFPQVNKLISMFLKAPHRVQFYKYHLQVAPLPPVPVPTRWGTWTEAINFYSEHFESVKSIVAKFPTASAVSVRESQSAFSDQEMACSIAYIRSNFGLLLEKIKRLETQGLPLRKSMDIMKM
jgi:hypothetical protein